jgi:tetrahydromethanopterin S-methyltransferase subunit G
MNRRLYFMLPDVDSAHAMMDEMLLARVNADHVHFLAKEGTDLGDLPEATVSERTDMIDGWEIGMGLGALLGLVVGLLATWIPPWPFDNAFPRVGIVICILIGLAAGGLWTAIVASAIPNVRLQRFLPAIERGRILMMVLVPFHRAQQIRELVMRRHPEAHYSGTWPTDHAVFP